MIKRFSATVIIFSLFVLGCSEQQATESKTTEAKKAMPKADSMADKEDKRPNIILLIADDMGYSDLASFGGEINTPNIDSLASAGKVMTDFHVGATCSPSRSMLLSGTDAHLAGLGTMNGMQSPEQEDKPGYEGFLNKNIVTFVSLLKDADYHTYMAGKWQQGYKEGFYPLDRGFEKAFWLEHGGASHFADMNGIMEYSHPTSWYEGRERLESLPEDFYTTNYFTDRLIDYIDSNKDDGKPFFIYGAYTAPHWPLHAPQETIDKYDGVYDGGYDVIRQARIERMQKLGLIAEGQATAPQHSEWPAWDELSADEQKREVKRMQVYAAMVDLLDENIGRLVQHLKDIGEYDNTFIMFFSDNGADGNNPMDLGNNATWVPTVFDNSYENMGKPGSYISTGPGWAHVSSTPFPLYKGFPTEGGLRSPTIAVMPETIKAGTRSDAFVSILDITPTILEMAEVEHPAPTYKGRTVHPMTGTSMLPFLSDEQDRVHEAGHVYGLELFNRRMIMQDDWKLVWINKPWGKNGWSLYNLAEDMAEQHDLAESQPEKLEQMLVLWDQYVEDNGVFVFPDVKVRYTNGKNHYQ